MLIQERLQLILKMHSLNPSAFADKLGIQRSNMSHVLSGRNKPSLDFLEKIILNFPRVNAHWLLTGQMPVNQPLIEDHSDSEFKREQNIKTSEEDQSESITKSIEKIVTFYSDETFDIHYPKKR